MKIDHAIAYYGSAVNLAKALDLRSHSVVYNWKTRNRDKRVPELYARKLRDLTGGKLRFDPKAYGLDS